MGKTVTLLTLAVLISGCASMSGVRTMNRENLFKLSIGMAKQEALNVMGAKSFETYTDGRINNPYRSETLSNKEGKVFEVLYYYTDIKRADDAITDDELTPLIFDNGRLIGWGWGFLQDNIQRYELRVR